MNENGPSLDEALFFNGINAASGGYLLGGLSTADLAEVARGASADPEAIEALRQKVDILAEQHFGTVEGVDPTALEEAGWGIVFPRVKPGTDEDKVHDDILAALEPLLARRRAQAGDRYKICRHNLGIPVGTGKGARAGAAATFPAAEYTNGCPTTLAVVCSDTVATSKPGPAPAPVRLRR
jgi:hypothetical protein